MAKLLSQGAYGCVYYPGFTCKGNIDNKKKFVTKLEIYDKTSKNEINISNKIKKIKNYSKFFSPVVNHCITRFNQINKNKQNLNDCEAVNVSEHIYNDFLLIYIKYINSKEIDKYLLEIDVPSIYVSKILKYFNYNIHAVKKLQENNLIHYDLHTGNILYDKDNQIPLIIDFGLSIDREIFIDKNNNIDYLQIKKSTMHYSPKHYTYPPELHFITYVLSNIDEKQIDNRLDNRLDNKLNKKLNESDIITFVNDLFEANKVQKRYIYYKELVDKNNNIDTYSYKKELFEYYKKYINKSIKDAIDSLIDSIKYLDNYTVTIDYSIILIKKLDKIIIEEKKKNNTVTKILFFLIELLSINLTVDIQKRFTIEEINNIYKIIFNRDNNSSKKILADINKDKELRYKFAENKKHFISVDFKIFDDVKVRDFFKIISNSL